MAEQRLHDAPGLLDAVLPGVLAVGPDTGTAVSLLVALEEAAEAELRAAGLRLSPLHR